MRDGAATAREVSTAGWKRDDGITIRPWQPGDTPAVNAFYNDPKIRPAAGSAGAVSRTDSQWEWEFMRGGDDAPAYAVASKNGQVIGTQAYIPITLSLAGTQIRTGKDEDTLVHPEFRGRGVLDDLYRLLISHASNDGIAALWGFTNSAVRPLLRNGFCSIGTFDSMTTNLRTPMLRKIGQGAMGQVGSIRLTTLNESSLEPSLDEFARAFSEQSGGAGLELSGAFLKWRVFDNPFRAYKVIAAMDRDRIVGLGIFKSEPGRKLGLISEVAVLSDASVSESDILRAIIAAGLEHFVESGFTSVEARHCGTHSYNCRLRTLLSEFGFESVRASSPMEFLVRPLSEVGEQLLDMNIWRVCELMREY